MKLRSMILGSVALALPLACAHAQDAPKLAPHLGPSERSTLQQSWTCSGRIIELRLALGEGGASPRVTAYSVAGQAISAAKLEQWNQALAPVSEFVRASTLCSSALEAVLIEGISTAPDGKKGRVTITASGGHGVIGGFTSNSFWTYSGN